MAQSAAERVQAHRARQRDLIVTLRAGIEEMGRRLAESRAEADGLRMELDGARSALAEAESRQCRHPSAVVQGGTCRACGTEVW